MSSLNISLYNKKNITLLKDVYDVLKNSLTNKDYYLTSLDDDNITKVKQSNHFTFIFAIDESDLDNESSFDRGFTNIRKNKINLVYNVKHSMLIYPEKRYDILDKANIIDKLVLHIIKRSETRHPKSLQKKNKADINDEVIQTFNEVGKRSFKNGYLPTVECGTYGNLSMRYQDGFVITGRNVDKGNLSRHTVNFISNVDLISAEQDNRNFAYVHYEGLNKPSIDSAIHYALYSNTNFKAIMHIHTERYFYGHPITDFNYPCGTESELGSIIRCMGENHIIQLQKHGLIVMNDCLEDCFSEIENLFSNEVSLEHFNTARNEYIYKEWVTHLIDVFPNGYKYFENKNNYLIRYGNNEIGIVYLDLSKEVPEFVIYIIPEHQKKNYGVGNKVVKIIESLVSTNGFKSIQLVTTEKCGVMNYYLRKHFFEYNYTADNGLIFLKKKL